MPTCRNCSLIKAKHSAGFPLVLTLCLVGVLSAGFVDLQAAVDPGPSGSTEDVGTPLVRETNFGSNPGNLNMWKYVPANVPPNAPLVLALHGCLQRAADYVNAGWNELADLWKFYVVYPEQRPENNPAYCFNWAGNYGDPTDLIRGRGENMSIKQMVDKMKADYSIDSQRVFIAGFSSGGAYAAVMLATWPDVFAGGAIIAGIPYYCASDLLGAFQCMGQGRERTPQQWGDLVRNAYPGFAGPYPPISIWHGTADTIVNPINERELVKQWTNAHGIGQTPDTTDTVNGYPHKVYKNSRGVALVETYDITGMGHGTPIEPGFAPANGCGRPGAYILDRGICSTYHIARAWGLERRVTLPPTVNITAPPDGATVRGMVTVSVNATHDVGVVRVELYVDGRLKDAMTRAPYQFNWNVRVEVNGRHTLMAKAYDAAGNVGTDRITVTVRDGITDITPPVVHITAPAEAATVFGLVAIAADASHDYGVARIEFYVDGALVGTTTTEPYTYLWDTTTYADGRHTINARAYNFSDTVGMDTRAVTIDQSAAGFLETFSTNGPDQAGWDVTQWQLTARDHTGVDGSQAIYGEAVARFSTVTKAASVAINLGARPTLSYWRMLDLLGANLIASARFQVIINDGVDHVVDEASVGFGFYAETDWTARAQIDLSAYANRQVTLKLAVTVTDLGSLLSHAQAWVDDIYIGN